MRNIHIKEVRPPPQADDDVVWNSLPKVALDLEDILMHYEEKKKVIKKKNLFVTIITRTAASGKTDGGRAGKSGERANCR